MKNFIRLSMVVLVCFLSACSPSVNEDIPIDEVNLPLTINSEEELLMDAIIELSKSLRNPDSLIIHNALYFEHVYENAEDFGVLIDISAENGFGGMNRLVYQYVKIGSFPYILINYDGSYVEFQIDSFITQNNELDYEHVLNHIDSK